MLNNTKGCNQQNQQKMGKAKGQPDFFNKINCNF